MEKRETWIKIAGNIEEINFKNNIATIKLMNDQSVLLKR